MTSAQYRIGGRLPLLDNLLPSSPFKTLYANRSLTVAVKSVADPTRQEVRVEHVSSGKIVFQTAAPNYRGRGHA